MSTVRFERCLLSLSMTSGIASCKKLLCIILAMFLQQHLVKKIISYQCLVSLMLSSICSTELYKMVCEKNETDLDINIPAVLLPKDPGSALHTLLTDGNAGKMLTHHCHQHFNFHVEHKGVNSPFLHLYVDSSYFGCLCYLK